MRGTIFVENLKAGYKKGDYILNIPKLRIGESEEKIFGIFGRNHAGKSTLLKILGKIFRGVHFSKETNIVYGEKSPQISYIPQRYSQAILPWFGINKNLALPLLAKGISNSNIEDKVNRVCASIGYVDKETFFKTFGFYETANTKRLKKPAELSGGQQQILVLLRGLVVKPSILIMDEPFSAIDTYLGKLFRRNLLDYIEDSKVTTIIVSHNLRDIVAMSDEIIFLQTIENDHTSSIVGKEKVGDKVRRGPNLDNEMCAKFLESIERKYLSNNG